MSFGFPSNPSNKKQYVTTDGKAYQYDSTRGAWAVGIRSATSANTVNITDVSQLADPDNLLDNPGSTLPVYASEESLYASTADLDIGQMAYISENGKIAIWNGSSWFGATTIEHVTPAPFNWLGDRALWITGNNEYNGPYAREIEYNDITTVGNSSDFADLAVNRAQYGAAAGSATYYLVGGGRNSDSGSSLRINNIDRGTVATLTNATDFGDLTQARNSNTALSDGNRALWGGGYTGSAYVNTIDYVTVDTPGNAQDFGDFNAGTANLVPGATNDDTRGVFAGSIGANQSNVIEYVTIATTGNAQDFGDLTHDGYGMAGVSDGTYGFFTGDSDNIEKITIQTPGNAIDFGSLTTASRRFLGAAANATRAVQAGGSTSADPGSTMEYFTMATGSDATFFGNLHETKTYVSGHSGNAS